MWLVCKTKKKSNYHWETEPYGARPFTGSIYDSHAAYYSNRQCRKLFLWIHMKGDGKFPLRFTNEHTRSQKDSVFSTISRSTFPQISAPGNLTKKIFLFNGLKRFSDENCSCSPGLQQLQIADKAKKSLGFTTAQAFERCSSRIGASCCTICCDFS